MSTPAGDSKDSGPIFEARELGVRYPGSAAPALSGVSLRVQRGSVCAVLGPNGSGKSTLLRALLGALPAAAGCAEFEGVDVRAWRRRRLARRIGVVPQIEETAFPLTVRELVAMGRYPHLGAWSSEAAADRAAIARALARCDVEELSARRLDTLSGGERQRARVARALAQEPGALVLDEPTASLDIRHEMTIFALLRELAREGVTVLLSTHNVNLAGRFADHVLLLDRGRHVAAGSPRDVLSREAVEAVWRWPVSLYEHAGPGPDAGAPQVAPLWRDADRAERDRHPQPSSSPKTEISP